MIEVSPARALSATVRERLLADALAIGRAAHYRSAGTVEFEDDNIMILRSRPDIVSRHYSMNISEVS